MSKEVEWLKVEPPSQEWVFQAAEPTTVNRLNILTLHPDTTIIKDMRELNAVAQLIAKDIQKHGNSSSSSSKIRELNWMIKHQVPILICRAWTKRRHSKGINSILTEEISLLLLIKITLIRDHSLHLRLISALKIKRQQILLNTTQPKQLTEKWLAILSIRVGM